MALCLLKLHVLVKNNYLMRKKLKLNHGSSHYQNNCKISALNEITNLNNFSLLKEHTYGLIQNIFFFSFLKLPPMLKASCSQNLTKLLLGKAKGK